MARTAARLLPSLAVLLLAACATTPRAPSAAAPSGGTVVTEEEIAAMSVRTAWDVVRMRAPRFVSALDERGRPTNVRIQETASVNADETPLLVLDGVSMDDVGYLRQIPASEVHRIRILRSETAQPVYGLRAAGGAIVVETKRGR